MRIGQYRIAKVWFRIASLMGGKAVASNNIGWALNSMGYYKDGLEALERAEQYDNLLPDLWNNRGWALLELGNDEEALEALNRCLELDPTLQFGLTNRIAIWMKLEKHEKAKEDLLSLVELYPNLHFGHCRLAQMYLWEYQKSADKQLLDLAEIQVKEAALLKPDCGVTFLSLARINLHSKKYDAALEALYESKSKYHSELSPHHLYSYEAVILTEMSRFDEALQAIQRARSDVDHSDYQEFEATIYHKKGDNETALRLFQAIEQLSANGWNNLGCTYIDLGRYDAANQALDKAMKKDPDLPHPWRLKGKIHYLEGNFVEARDAVNQALSLRPTFEPALRLKNKLDSEL